MKRFRNAIYISDIPIPVCKVTYILLLSRSFYGVG